jgi:LSD1 subclass zinc finger protein
MKKADIATGDDLFPCTRCGALLKYAPGTNHLKCEFCGQENQIESHFSPIKEYDLSQALSALDKATPVADSQLLQCANCGAEFKFAKNVYAGECPFCGTPIVAQTAAGKAIKPRSLLPFKVTDREAMELFRDWLKHIWFAPNKVKRFARSDSRLKGVYLPYWTFDSYTETRYTGARGDVYYVNQRVSYVENGRRVTRMRRVPKIRWTPVRGRVSRFFDDVLVEASNSLPRQLLDRLQPWDLENLIPYDKKYLSGLSSEYYQIDLDQGYDRARQIMERIIYQDIAFDIGGDQQRVHSLHTQHSNNTYKHCLLPVWSAAFRYRNKTYRFVINGRTGEVQGERPYSIWKIASAILLALVVGWGAFVLLERSGAFDQPDQGVTYQYR